ncbi:MAG: hypothetical protein EXS69_01500 [Candidatus Zambryskibacteria bacterium]|nr:hypothetical protein [Candidatus Zambryskibacteria bacterium]
MKNRSKYYEVWNKKLVFVLILTTYFLLPTTYSLAVTSNDLLSRQIESEKEELEALEAEQKRLENELEKTSVEKQNLGTAVKSLDATRKKLTQDIKVTRSKITSTDLNIKVLENNVNTAKRQIDTHQKAVSTAIRALFASESRPILLELLAATNFGDAWKDISQLEGLSVKLDDEVRSLRETKAALSLEKVKKEKVKEEILSLNRELGGQREVVEENQKAKEKLLAETKNKEVLYQQMLAENLARQEESEQDLFKLESELKFGLDPTLIPTPRSGILSWPLDVVFITQSFGKTVGAARLYSSGSHNGVDFRAKSPMPVKAMMSGIVEGTGNTDEQRGCYSYGRWVLMKHPNGLSTIYAHLSAIIVANGQSIKTGGIIGYSGGTPRVFGSGYSTGPHLHVGLFASQGVRIDRFVTSRGCKQVFLPLVGIDAYLDPLAYLPSI